MLYVTTDVRVHKTKGIPPLLSPTYIRVHLPGLYSHITLHTLGNTMYPRRASNIFRGGLVVLVDCEASYSRQFMVVHLHSMWVWLQQLLSAGHEDSDGYAGS